MDAAGRERIGMMGTRGRTGAAAVLAALTVIGCADLSTPAVGPESIWEASLSPRMASPDPEAPPVTGKAAAVVQNGITSAGISLEGLEVDLHWGLFEGGCAQPGPRLGSPDDYPRVTTGDPSSEATVAAELSTLVSYHVRATHNPDGTSTVACGELIARDEV